MATQRVELEINGSRYAAEIEPRMLLSDFIRHEAGLYGTHVGCEHGVCGACTVQIDGQAVRSCLMLAVQAQGLSIRTVEGLGEGLAEGELNELQEAFRQEHGLQCGFCTPGFLMTLDSLLGADGVKSEEEIREALAGNLCRCTGYQNIVRSFQRAIAASRERADA